MTDDIKLKRAYKLYSDGEVEESAKLSLDVYENTTDPFSKLQAINFLTSCLNKVKDNERLLELCEEGLELSKQLFRDDIMATYMAFKAECLMHNCMRFNYKMGNMKMAPGWSGFALENERKEYEKLEKQKNDIEDEIEKLIIKAEEIAEDVDDKMILVRVLRSGGSVLGTQSLFLAMEQIKHSKMYVFFRENFGIQSNYFFKNRKEIEMANDECIDCLLKAAEIAKPINESEYAYVLFGLVSQLSIFGRKREAKKYLKKAEQVANRLNEKDLIGQVSALREIINKKPSEEDTRPPVFD